MNLTEVGYFRSSLFRRFSSAVALHDSYPRLRSRGDDSSSPHQRCRNGGSAHLYRVMDEGIVEITLLILHHAVWLGVPSVIRRPYRKSVGAWWRVPRTIPPDPGSRDIGLVQARIGRTRRWLHQRRLRLEHVNSRVKRCRIVKDRIRLWKEGVRDVVMALCCALHNVRVRLTAWQPMI